MATLIQHEYETIYVVRPELPPADLERIMEKLKGVIEQRSGVLLHMEDWGERRLAYPIRKHSHGHYVYLDYVGPAAVPNELERNMRIEDNLIRFLTVKLGQDVEIEECRKQAEERHRIRAERLASLRAEEEAGLRREEDEHADEDADADELHDDLADHDVPRSGAGEG